MLILEFCTNICLYDYFHWTTTKSQKNRICYSKNIHVFPSYKKKKNNLLFKLFRHKWLLKTTPEIDDEKEIFGRKNVYEQKKKKTHVVVKLIHSLWDHFCVDNYLTNIVGLNIFLFQVKFSKI